MTNIEDYVELKDRLSRLRDLKRNYKDLDSQRKAAKAELDKFQAELFAEMEEHGFEGHKFDGSRFTPARTVFGHVNDEEKFADWCRDNDLEDVYFRPKERSQQVNELVRECIDQGKDFPPGVTFYAREYISITDTE